MPSSDAADLPAVGSGGHSTGGIAGTDASQAGETQGTGGTGVDVGSVDLGLSGYDVKVDPYGTNPLVAVVNLRGVKPSEVQGIKVVVTGQDGGQDFEKTYSPANPDFVAQLDTSDLTFPEPGYHVPVLGLYADRENGVRILVDLLDGGRVDLTLKIQTRLAKSDEAAWVPSIQVRTAVPERMEPGWTVAEISIEPSQPDGPIVFVDWTRTIAFDERGAIRWALRLDLPKGETFTMTRSLTGNFLSGSLDTLVEVTKLGRITRSLKLAEHSLNHEIIQIGSEHNGEGGSNATPSKYFGNILALASKNDATTIQDRILEVDPDLGGILNEWDLAKVFDPARTTFLDAEGWTTRVDWLHENGLVYSAADESIIVSARHQGVAKIRRDGSLVWLLAPHKGWNEPQASKLLTAVNATQTPYDETTQLGNKAAGDAAAPEFGWPFGQHSPDLLPNGDLLLFDNGASRHWKGYCQNFSRAVIYRIDEAAMTVRQIGQFIFSKAESSCYVSNTHRLPLTGNIFIQPGGMPNNTGSNTKEVTVKVAADGTIAFDTVVFDATADLRVIGSSSYAYAFRGHRWAF